MWFPVHLMGALIPLWYETLVVNWQSWLFTLFHQSRSVLSPNPISKFLLQNNFPNQALWNFGSSGWNLGNKQQISSIMGIFLAVQAIISMSSALHDEIMRWICRPDYWPFVREIPVNGQNTKVLFFCLFSVKTSCSTNSWVAGDMRCHNTNMTWRHSEVNLGYLWTFTLFVSNINNMFVPIYYCKMILLYHSGTPNGANNNI